MNSSIKIIVLSPSRWEDYKNLRLESLKEEPRAFGTSYEKASKESEEKWRSILINAEKQDKDILYFAEDNGKLIGIMGVYFNKNPESEDIGMIYGVYVNKAYRGKGIGKQLTKKVLERLQNMPGLKKAKLCVNQEQETAVKFYKALGFQIVGTECMQLGDGLKHDLFVMEKKFKGKKFNFTKSA